MSYGHNKIFTHTRVGDRKRRSLFIKGKGDILFVESLHCVNQEFTVHSNLNFLAVKLRRDGEDMQDVAIGAGPLDAAFQVINRLSGMDVTLKNFSLNAVTDGEDAIGEATVKLVHAGKSVTGRGLSTDIIEASVLA